MNTHHLLDNLRNELENELKNQLEKYSHPPYELYHHMLAYHLGWEGEGTGNKASGKRIRPTILLLVTAANEADWQKALPIAAAVELIHNFSLIHDDIEDSSQYRRGRLTVWYKWGIAQGINAGDAMFTMAHLAIHKPKPSFLPETVLQISNILLQTCLELTQGQFLDIGFESRSDVTVPEYWTMINGKTAALFAASAELGAVAAACPPDVQEHYRNFGRKLGLAFQIVDDILGIWGDEALLGKSTTGDLCSGKKTLPVLLGVQNQGKFAHRWQQGNIQPDEVPDLAKTLEEEGVLSQTQSEAERLTTEAMAELTSAKPVGLAAEALFEIAQKLTFRKN